MQQMYRIPITLATTVLALSGLSACNLHESRSYFAPPMVETLGYSHEGRPIEAYVLGTGKRALLLFGAIHGNEPAGAYVLKAFAEELRNRPEVLAERRIVIIPNLNPDGFERRTRRNARGVDLNRNFPARNWSAQRAHGDHPASEPETRALLRVLRQFNVERALAIHAPLGCINYDGPAAALAQDIATATGLPVQSYIGYATPGSFGSYAGGDLSIPTITVETRGEPNEAAWQMLRPGLQAFVEDTTTLAAD